MQRRFADQQKNAKNAKNIRATMKAAAYCKYRCPASGGLSAAAS